MESTTTFITLLIALECNLPEGPEYEKYINTISAFLPLNKCLEFYKIYSYNPVLSIDYYPINILVVEC